MLELILPAGVESEERFGAASGGVLFPEEEKIIAHAVESRRREYAAVRSCARACLGRLGYPRVPILPGLGGAPTWPAGVLGSMTHCAGYAAAAVGPDQRISAIGIDAEPDAPLPDGVFDLVATPDRTGSPRRHPAGTGRPELGPVAVQRQRGRLQGLVPTGRGVAGPPSRPRSSSTHTTEPSPPCYPATA